jgi:pimeloyl-ACP methyl ester carboxylesterase
MNERLKRREEALRKKAAARERKLELRRQKVETRRELVEAKRELVEAKRDLAEAERAQAIGPTVHPGELEAEPIFGGQVYVVDLGPKDAPAVVLVHGVGDNAARDWDGLIPALAGTRRVITFDLPGFGRSTKANAAYKPDAYVKLIKHVVGARLSRPFDLIGHSMGGAIALGYAGANPGDVERLVIADAAGILHRHAFGEYAMHLGIRGVPGWDAMTDSPFGAALGGILGGIAENFAHKVIRPYFRVEPNPSTIFELEAVREKILGGDPLKIAGLFLITKSFGPAIAAIASPPLLIWGEDDRIAPLRTGLMLRSMLPGGRLEVLPGCGHVPMKERRERFNELVIEWLAAPPRAREKERARGPASGPEVRLTGEQGRTIIGEHERLVIDGCEGILLRDVRAKSVVIRRSGVELEGCDLAGEEIALDASYSRVRVTGGSISAAVAIRIEGSDLDLAGTSVEGRAAAVRGAIDAQVLFSVCPVRSPRSAGFLHGVYRVSATEDI